MSNYTTKKTCFKLVLFFSSAIISQFSIVASGSEAIPEHWYTSSVAGNKDMSSKIRNASPSKRAEKRWSSLFRINGAAFDKIRENGDMLNFFESETSWELSNIELELGLSSSGMIGVFVGEGSIGAAVNFGRKENTYRSRSTRNTSARNPSIFLNGKSTPQSLSADLDDLISVIELTGKIDNLESTKTQLFGRALEFRDLMMGVATPRSHKWQFSKYAISFSIGAAGMVQPGIMVGGLIEVHFEWIPVAESFSLQEETQPNLTHQRKAQDSLSELLKNVESELNSIPQDSFESEGFDLEQIRVGVGVFAEVDFGIVEGELSLHGYAYFTQVGSDTEVDPGFENAKSSTMISLIYDNPSRQEISFAEQKNMDFLVFEEGFHDLNRAKFEVSGSDFGRGLLAANKMCSWMLKMAKKSSSKKWEPVELESEFSLSLAGDLSIVTIGASASIKLTYEKSSR